MQKRDLWSAAAGAALASGAILGARGVTSSAGHAGDVAGAGTGEDVLEASLRKTEEKLAAAQSDGGLGKRRNEWDLTQDEWKDLDAEVC